MSHLRVVGKEEQKEEKKKKTDWPELALDAITEFCKESEFLANLPTDSVAGFVMCINTEDGILIVGDKPDPDYLQISLDDALFSLKFRKNVTGEVYVDE